MPVCLKCGREIDPGRKFCEDCGVMGEREALEAVSEVETKYRPRRSHNTIWIVVLMVVLFSMALGLGYGILTMIPNSKKIKTEAQANLCHRNLVNGQSAIEKYYKNSRFYPPAGRLNAQYPLIIDRYIKTVPKCPTTGHEYIIKNMGVTDPTNPQKANVKVYCDSGLKGHSL